MNKSLKKLLALVNVNGKIEGRKKFQKLVYILKHIGFNFEEKYRYHYYGPYSSTLQMEIDSLVQSDLLAENKYGNTYEYTLTKKSNTFLENNYEDEEIAFIRKLNNKPAYILELVSVFFYLEDKGYNPGETMKKKISILKPELRDNIEEAYELYLNIKNKKCDALG